MSNEEAAQTPAPDPVEPAVPAESDASVEPVGAAAPTEPAEPLEEAGTGAADPGEADRTPVIEEVEREVSLQRSVRYGRVLVGGAALGAVVATIASLFFPIEEGAEYTMAQAVGFFAVLGAAIGLGLGSVVALVLGLVARRQRGTGVAIQSDVR